MADMQPFRGWRYDLAQVGSLADVIAPPYDVINADEQNALYQKHPCNVVRLILNRDEPGDDSPNARYERAANFLRHWKSEGILQQDREDSVYVYHQIFDWEGVHYERKGFLGRLKLEEFGKGQVFPHEQTMSGPKADRLLLTKACKTNLSPIFGLYPDPETVAQNALEEVIRTETALEVTDELGVLHRFWPVSDHAAIAEAVNALADKPIFIADGHHRYETAVNYRNELEAAGELDDNPNAKYVLMMFVGMSDPGLAILPTHRLISGLPAMTVDDVTRILGDHFELERMGTGPEAAQQTWDMMDADGGQDVFGFATNVDQEWVFARVTDASPMQELCPDQSDAWRGLGVSLLHKLVLEHLFANAYPDAEQSCKYVHLMSEVNEGLAGDTPQLACLVPPAQIEHVQEIASHFEKMPPKSTFFYPKLLSGLVFNPLD
ncbi:MAG: DUF1015 domain-containing protein [Planctomycetaceae bacterium]